MKTLTLGDETLVLPLVLDVQVDSTYIDDAKGVSVAAIGGWEHEKKARMLAASPDLLLAAESLLRVLPAPVTFASVDPETAVAVEALRTAIARARGIHV